jgi:hypothetical protein
MSFAVGSQMVLAPSARLMRPITAVDAAKLNRMRMALSRSNAPAPSNFRRIKSAA